MKVSKKTGVEEVPHLKKAVASATITGLLSACWPFHALVFYCIIISIAARRHYDYSCYLCCGDSNSGNYTSPRPL